MIRRFSVVAAIAFVVVVLAPTAMSASRAQRSDYQQRATSVAGALAQARVAGKKLASPARSDVDAERAACNTFNDPPGDNEAGLAPDITTVQVCSDAAGNLTFTISIPTEIGGIGPGQFYLIFLDTDRNPATGSFGADYAIAVDGDTGTIILGRWNGSTWDFVTPQATLTGSFAYPNLVLNINRSDLGATAGFDFDVAASWSPGGTENYYDFAPDFGSYNHQVQLPPPSSPPPPPVVQPLTCATSGATAGDDEITGTALNDVICGGGGSDRIRGGGGNDVIYGGPGGDTLLGQVGADRLYGQGGGDHLRGGDGIDRLIGGASGDRLEGDAASDVISGGRGGDTMLGWAGNDLLTGGGGRDFLSGMAGGDTLRARDGVRDTVYGGPGTDRASIDCALDRKRSVERLSPSCGT
jgi:Ca2+-binding RTX toxin-like protein